MRHHEKPPQVPTYSYLLLAFGLAALAISCFGVYAHANKLKDIDIESLPMGWIFIASVGLLIAWAVSQVIHNRAVNKWYESRRPTQPQHNQTETTRKAF